jgi:aspartate/methionine/tyrosine aminotransferase
MRAKKDPIFKHEMALAASKRSQVEPFIAMEVLREANWLEAEGADILHLEVGQPGTQAPLLARTAAKLAIDGLALGYTDALGISPLRERISQHYRDVYGLDVPIERIAVTTGSSGGFILAFLASFDPGDRVSLAVPGYPAYFNTLEALGLGVETLETSADTRWVPTADQVLASHLANPLAGLLLASPGNPTGTMLMPDDLAALVNVASENNIRVISDEIYHGLTYDAPAETALKYSEDVIIVNSFSKYYSMTGWRIGWLILPENLARAAERLAQSLFISVPAVSQQAAIAAFDATEELEANKQVYARNRALLAKRLPEIGLGNFLPMDGAFYVFIDVSAYTNDSRDFASRLLQEAHVALTPGADFDRTNGHRYVRLSFAGKHEVIAAAIDRIGDWLKSAK